MDESLDAPAGAPETEAAQSVSRFKWIGWSSLFLALVQSVCTIFVALSGLRLQARSLGPYLDGLRNLSKLKLDPR